MNDEIDESFTIKEINGRTDVEAIDESYTMKRSEARERGITGRTNILAAANLDEDELLFHVITSVYAARKNMAWEGFETTDEEIKKIIAADLEELKIRLKR